MTHIAYLDISPRQTGKSTRLIKRANECAATGRPVVFVTFEGLVDQFQQQMPDVFVLRQEQPLPANVEPDEVVWFYDEFDWYEGVEVKAGGYYATTPRFLRKLGDPANEDDLLLQLVKAAQGHFERFYWPFDIQSAIDEARQTHTPEQFRHLYLGEFLQ